MKVSSFRVRSLAAAALAACASCQGDHMPSSPTVSAAAQALEAPGAPSAAVCSVVGPPPKDAPISASNGIVFPKFGPELTNRMKDVGKQPPPPDSTSSGAPAWLVKKQREFLEAVAAAEPSWSKLSCAANQFLSARARS